MTKKKQWLWIVFACILYMGAYVGLRVEGEIVHRQNRGLSIGHTVDAHPKEWDHLAVEMAKSKEKDEIHERWGAYLLQQYGKRYAVWNMIFWPPRKMEELFWDIGQYDKKDQQSFISTLNRVSS